MRNKVIIAVLAASAGWGLAGVGTRAAYQAGATTLTILTIRTAIAAAVLTVFVVISRPTPSRLAWRHGALIGALRVGINPMLFMASLNYISAGVEGLVITLIPAVTTVVAAVTIKERTTRRQVIGLLIGLTGTAIIGLAGDSGLAVGGDIGLGFAFAGAGVITASFSGVMQRRYAPLHDTVSLALPMFLSGAVVAVVGGLIIGFDDVSTYQPDLWALLGILAIGATLMPFSLTLYASKHASATIVAMTAYVAPMVAVAGGALLLGEQITPAIIVGAMFAVIGVAMVGGRRRVTT